MKINFGKLLFATFILLTALLAFAMCDIEGSAVNENENYATDKRTYYKLRKKLENGNLLGDDYKQFRLNFYLTNALREKAFIDSMMATQQAEME